MKARNINVILTHNIKDYKGSKLSVMTPKSYIKAVIASR